MPADERLFNYLHSRTQIAVERAIRMLKNRFSILKLPLNQKSNSITGSWAITQMVKIVQACFVLHNIFLSLNDSIKDTAEPDFEDSERHVQEQGNESQQGRGHAISIRNSIKDYLYETRRSQ
jgi:hypothetical protein